MILKQYVKAAGSRVYVWDSIGERSVGRAAQVPGISGHQVQVFGNFGSAMVRLEGSLEDVPEHWFPLLDAYGDSIYFSGEGSAWSPGLASHVRPVVKGGEATNLTVIVMTRSKA